MNDKPRHTIQFACIMVLLGAIVLQGFTRVVIMKPLSPYTSPVVVEEKDLSFKTYLDGSYQEYLADYARQRTGFMEFFARCHNQVGYAFFGEIGNENVVKGENKELFLKGTLDDITGKLLLSRYGTVENAKADAQKNVQETLALIDTLRRHGTQFLFVFCPSKPFIYPESLPKGYRDSIADFVLEDYYIRLFKEQGIPHIDFLSYFKSIKDTFPYPLYTRTGSHWAESTIPFVADTLLRKMEAVSGLKLPSVNYIAPNLSRNYSDQDGELETHIDLLLPMCKPKVPQPVFALQDTIGKDRPNLLVVGDGYFVLFENTPFLDAFDSWNYWKYNDDIISSDPKYNWQKVKSLPEAREMLEQADIVMAMFTSNYLLNYMCGFIPTAMDFYRNAGEWEQKAIQSTIESIQANPEWLRAVERQAKEKGITVEENLRRNAEYVLKTNRSEKRKQP